MSISLLTNHSATLAAQSVSSVGANLQLSLNRLSSGSRIVSPSDDAGGLAVSMKMSAAIKRQAATSSNISNAMSYLQTQDGALDSVGQILSRIGELKTLSDDVTKNANDKANYETEFKALQAQLADLSESKFNGMSLFGPSALQVAASADGVGASVPVGGADLMAFTATPAFPVFSDSFDDLSNWSDSSGGTSTVATASNYLTLTTNNPAGSGDASVTSNSSFSGPFSLSLDFTPNGPFQVDIGGTNVFDHPSGSTHSLRIEVDETGAYSTYLDGSDTAYSSGSGISGSNQVTLRHVRQASTMSNVHIQNFSIQSTAGTSTSVGAVGTSGTLGGLSVSLVKKSIEEVATLRATNGAQQSRLNFAREMVDVNKANLSSANSRIKDVDIASESTNLARLNILQQAGASMLSQANQSQQVALKLIG